VSDPRQDRELTINSEPYPVRFTHTALARAEELTGSTVQQLAVKLFSGQFGFREQAALTCAGLEGARRKLRLGGKPWTMKDTQDLLDDADNFDTVMVPVVEAFQAALERWFPAEQEPADPQTARAGTGTDSSGPDSAQD
jgi:hypothetical protein